jgi:hypothetical protein
MASENELQVWCEGFADRNGVPRTPCPCIVKAIGSNDALKSEMMSMQTIDQYFDTGSAPLRAAVDPCIPPRK